ncbi:MAG: ArsC/Spx/MgsR family protein [Melioribacteraceae bacterium]
MNIQIFGTKKCNSTKKTQRFFKERNIKIHFRDLTEKGLSNGELQNILRAVSLDDLLDTESKQYKKRGLQFMVFNLEEELLEDPLLLKFPIVRNGKEVTIGYEPDVWKGWE